MPQKTPPCLFWGDNISKGHMLKIRKEKRAQALAFSFHIHAWGSTCDWDEDGLGRGSNVFGNSEEQAVERECCPEPKAVPSGLPWERSPPCHIGRRDHPGTCSFAYSGLQARLLYLNWFINSVKQMVWLIFFFPESTIYLGILQTQAFCAIGSGNVSSALTDTHRLGKSMFLDNEKKGKFISVLGGKRQLSICYLRLGREFFPCPRSRHRHPEVFGDLCICLKLRKTWLLVRGWQAKVHCLSSCFKSMWLKGISAWVLSFPGWPDIDSKKQKSSHWMWSLAGYHPLCREKNLKVASPVVEQSPQGRTAELQQCLSLWGWPTFFWGWMIDVLELRGPGMNESAGESRRKWNRGFLLNSCLFWDSMMLFSERANKVLVEGVRLM